MSIALTNTYCIVWQFHELHDEVLLLRFIRLRRNHMPYGLVESVHLLWCEIDCDAVKEA